MRAPILLEAVCSEWEVRQWQVESGLAGVANLSISGGEAGVMEVDQEADL